MSIVIKVRRVQKVFEALEHELTQLQKRTGIFCLTSCGQCCTKPDIEASVLEFLPLAFELFLENKTFLYREKMLQSASGICTLFDSFSMEPNGAYAAGRCFQYEYRGLICRLFGYASFRDKLGNKKLSTCKLIKGTYPEEINRLYDSGEIESLPNYTNYYQKLVQIDFRLSQEILPINHAIMRAIEEVESYYCYRHFPYRYRRRA